MVVKTFNSAREFFRYYIPGYIEREDRERILGPYETREQNSYNTKLVEGLLEDFRLSLEGIV